MHASCVSPWRVVSAIPQQRSSISRLCCRWEPLREEVALAPSTSCLMRGGGRCAGRYSHLLQALREHGLVPARETVALQARLRARPGPLATLSQARTNLHWQPQSSGRQHEIAAVRELCAASDDILMLTGVGGCGRLAWRLEVAGQLVAGFHRRRSGGSSWPA